MLFLLIIVNFSLVIIWSSLGACCRLFGHNSGTPDSGSSQILK
jgi:hypothetical protein